MASATLAVLIGFLGFVIVSGPAQGQPAAPAVEAPAHSIAKDYTLAVNDHVKVTVFREPTLSGDFVVNANGAISMPLIGEVPAEGHTADDLGLTLTRRFADGYLRDPKINVVVTTFRPFYILGEVNKPGEYPFSIGLTVLDAVATAQGFSVRADKRRIFVRHAGQSAETMSRLKGTLLVQPGDTIRVGERYF
jgi:polysaccharide export outer membrane protein